MRAGISIGLMVFAQAFYVLGGLAVIAAILAGLYIMFADSAGVGLALIGGAFLSTYAIQFIHGILVQISINIGLGGDYD